MAATDTYGNYQANPIGSDNPQNFWGDNQCSTVVKPMRVCGLDVSIGDVTLGDIAVDSAGPSTAAATALTATQVNGTTSGTPGTATRFTAGATPAQWAIIESDIANTDDVFLGPNSSANFHSLVPGSSYNIPIPAGAKIDLMEWYVMSATASQVFRIVYIA